MHPFWVSWTAHPDKPFTYEGPWWCSGYAYYTLDGDDEFECPTICAAVMARDEEHAKAIIVAAHDNGDGPRGTDDGPNSWRFVTQRPDNWEPGSDRFPRADWMQWPWPTDPTASGGGGK